MRVGMECSTRSFNQQIVGEEACGIPDVTEMELAERSDMEVGRVPFGGRRLVKT